LSTIHCSDLLNREGLLIGTQNRNKIIHHLTGTKELAMYLMDGSESVLLKNELLK